MLLGLPKNDDNISKNDKYLMIMPVFDEFMTEFQREESIIHSSHPNSEKPLKTTMARLMKSKVCILRRRESTSRSKC